MTTDNDSVREQFEQTMAPIFAQEFGMNPDPSCWHKRPDSSYLSPIIEQHFATWQASRERYAPKPELKSEERGCHCDLEDSMKPDNCVIDTKESWLCIHAKQLVSEGKGRNDCEYWQPIVVATPNGGNGS